MVCVPWREYESILNDARFHLTITFSHWNKYNPTDEPQQYEKYFAANAVENGGSFYLQSKVYRAKEQLDEFIKEKRMEDKQEQQQSGQQ